MTSSYCILEPNSTFNKLFMHSLLANEKLNILLQYTGKNISISQSRSLFRAYRGI